MDKKSLMMLEVAFGAEIDGARYHGSGLMRSKSKLAKQLAKDGYLELCQVTLPGRFPVVIEGYKLTMLGHFTYCTSDLCADLPTE